MSFAVRAWGEDDNGDGGGGGRVKIRWAKILKPLMRQM